MAEASNVFKASFAGEGISINIICEKSVVPDLCLPAVTLYGIYTASNLMARSIDGIVNRGLGGPRNDQGMFIVKWLSTRTVHFVIFCDHHIYRKINAHFNMAMNIS